MYADAFDCKLSLNPTTTLFGWKIVVREGPVVICPLSRKRNQQAHLIPHLSCVGRNVKRVFIFSAICPSAVRRSQRSCSMLHSYEIFINLLGHRESNEHMLSTPLKSSPVRPNRQNSGTCTYMENCASS